MEIVWIFVCSGLFELAMIVVIVLANSALQGEEQRQRLLEQFEGEGTSTAGDLRRRDARFA